MHALEEAGRLAEERNFAAVEEGFLAWIQARAFAAGDGERIAGVADRLVEAGRKELAASLLSLAFPELPPAEAIPVLKKLVRTSPKTPGLATELIERIQTVHQEPTVRAALRASELGRDENPAHALDRFEKFCTVRDGIYVRHRGDWGSGRVKSIDGVTGQVVIDFERRAGQRMTLEGVVELLDVLPEDSWLARKFDRLGALQELARRKPAELLRLVLAHLGGKAELAELRGELKGSVIPADRWNRWWTTAKKAAMNDPYLDVKTAGAATSILVREDAVTPADQMKEGFAKVSDFASKWELARAYLRQYTAGQTPGVLAPLLVESIQSAGDRPVTECPEALAECLVLLESVGWDQSGPRLEALASATEGRILDRLGSKEVQRRFALACERAILPDGGRRAFARALLADGTKIRQELRALLAGAPEALRDVEGRLLADPLDSPEAFLDVLSGEWRLAAPLEESDIVRAAARFVHDVTRTRSLGKTTLERYVRRAREFLEGNQLAALKSYIETRSDDEVSRLASYLRRTDPVSDLYHMLRHEIHRRLPHEVVLVTQRFWENEFLFSTRAGIEKFREEIRYLQEVEYPKITEAIGRAQEMGDLSENAEWTAAIEKRNELTDRLKKMRDDLERAMPLDEVEIPTHIVAPGSRVHLLDLELSEEKVYAVLGPWDSDVDRGILSYLSPIANGLLGKQVGEEAVVELPGMVHRYEVRAIEHFLDESAADRSVPGDAASSG